MACSAASCLGTPAATSSWYFAATLALSKGKGRGGVVLAAGVAAAAIGGGGGGAEEEEEEKAGNPSQPSVVLLQQFSGFQPVLQTHLSEFFQLSGELLGHDRSLLWVHPQRSQAIENIYELLAFQRFQFGFLTARGSFGSALEPSI
eukprot:CAMPEP_0206593168 /NCGR_PEP_ID=MMETSP0325_2-20121206/41477_1 /ASSEMBLY_ACC=CAM_ASM_000347 /TAXON_ID=2866 /ORGANISM="Crypthecodinium cohnii, Strain Seligo" /LENGTH=145 /DNA_ID=CAMNT_0054103105 /DNA_START=286 /DNA_END=723 /DNA_ORIENTATION=-